MSANPVRMPYVQGMAPSQEMGVSPVFSVVAPIYNEQDILPHFYRRVVAVMEALGETFELIFVDDGSRDKTFPMLNDIAAHDSRVRVINFSRNFGHQVAISAGLDYARGRAVILMDSDLQDPPEVIPTLVAQWRAGGEVVYAQRTKRPGETPFKLLTASAFYRIIARITSIDIPRDTGDFRLLDRRAVDALVGLREQHRFLRGLSVWVGFRQVAVPYERQERPSGSTKYPFWKMLRFSLDAITGFSYVPLQLATTAGFFLAGLSLLGIIAAIFLRLINHEIEGQASTLILVLFLGGVQLVFLGILGEYLGRIYDEVRARPLYIVREVVERNPTPTVPGAYHAVESVAPVAQTAPIASVASSSSVPVAPAEPTVPLAQPATHVPAVPVVSSPPVTPMMPSAIFGTADDDRTLSPVTAQREHRAGEAPPQHNA